MGNDLHIIRNYDEPLDNGPAPMKSVSKRKLTREELLAGYSSVYDLPENAADPRFKSPDELLLKRAPKKPSEIVPEVKMPVAPPPIDLEKKTEPVKPLKKPEEKIHYAMPDLDTLRTELEEERQHTTPVLHTEPSSFSPLFATAELKPQPAPAIDPSAELIAKHEKEISQWKEYAASVKAWQAQVMDVVEKLKAQAHPSKDKDEEIQRLKAEVQKLRDEQDHEGRKDKQTILGWMKNIGRPPHIRPH